ncbi:MAG: BamA/TamA family outer membrane protein [Sandaracinaceae bacterium]
MIRALAAGLLLSLGAAGGGAYAQDTVDGPEPDEAHAADAPGTGEVRDAVGPDDDVADTDPGEGPGAGVAAQAAPATRAARRAPLEPPRDPYVDRPASPPPAEASTPPQASGAPPGDGPSSPRREVPDLDGRPDGGTSVGDALLWIPRVLFFPVHVVLEYVLRLPLSGLVTWVEKSDLPVFFIDLFTFGERQNAGLVPTAFIDFGFQPAIGLFFFSNDVLAEGNAFRAQAAFGGDRWLRLAVSDRVTLREGFEAGVGFEGTRRPDFLYDGFGFNSRVATRSRYTRNRIDGSAYVRFEPWRASRIELTGTVRHTDYVVNRGSAPFQSNPTLLEAVIQGFYDLPPGFQRYFAFIQRIEYVIDSRLEAPASGTGIRLASLLELGFDFNQPIARRWIRYGGRVGGFLDLGENRVIGLSGLLGVVDPIGTDPVPFSELVFLGGDTIFMDGFLEGQLVDRSAVVATLEYRYPIWVWLDASVHASLGNVFEERFADFDMSRLRYSFGVGFRSVGDRDNSFSLTLAFGSRPFSEGGDITSVRFFFGTTTGF